MTYTIRCHWCQLNIKSSTKKETVAQVLRHEKREYHVAKIQEAKLESFEELLRLAREEYDTLKWWKKIVWRWIK
jgi:hypothetical protein